MAVYTPLPCGHTVTHGARDPAPECKQCAFPATAPASPTPPSPSPTNHQPEIG